MVSECSVAGEFSSSFVRVENLRLESWSERGKNSKRYRNEARWREMKGEMEGDEERLDAFRV